MLLQEQAKAVIVDALCRGGGKVTFYTFGSGETVIFRILVKVPQANYSSLEGKITAIGLESSLESTASEHNGSGWHILIRIPEHWNPLDLVGRSPIQHS